MIQLWSIAANTFLQTIRQPIYTALVLITFALLVLTLPFAGYTLSVDYHETDQRMMEDIALATLRISSLLIAAFSASGVLRREIEEKTALIVLTKPVSRATFVLGKFAGVAAAVAVAYYLSSLVFLMTARHKVMPAAFDKADWPVIVLGLSGFALTVLITMAGNLFFGWPFTSTGVLAGSLCLSAAMVAIGFVGKDWHLVPFGTGLPAQRLLELVMMFMAAVIFSALAVTASTRLGQAMTLLVCAGVFFVGSAHPQIIGRWAGEMPVARVLGWVTPNFTYFYPQDDLTVRGPVPLKLVGSAALYCVLYSTGVLAVGIALFQRRELEATTASAAPTLVALIAWVGRGAALAAALGALVLVSLPASPTSPVAWRYGAAAGLLAGAVVGWLIWGAFARGSRWSYWLVLAGATLALAGALVLLVAPGLVPDPQVAAPILLFAGAAVAGGALLVLVLPKTRRHFSFGGR